MCVTHLISAFNKAIEAKPHSPVYTMHKYFARRPWNVFRELISHYTAPGDIVLDPFCGGGVTIVEALKLERKAIGVDLNSLATYVTRKEIAPVDLGVLQYNFAQLGQNMKQEVLSFYSTECSNCKSQTFADWIEWDEETKQITRLKYNCVACGFSGEKSPTSEDISLAKKLGEEFDTMIVQRKLWYPTTDIPPGDKTSSLLSRKINRFYQLFTKRNLLALALLKSQIDQIDNEMAKDFLNFALSSSLKWASRQSHLRGKIVEGWAMHAYWIYPKSLEINVWNTFERRFQAVYRGKRYGDQQIVNCKVVETFEELEQNPVSCLILTRSSADLPLPDCSIDAVITDPPYGGNVNYAELSDYWVIWTSGGRTTDKGEEAIINKTRNKKLDDYQAVLHAVFKESYRVLKPQRYLVSTFNSKDLRVVGSFVIAASQAGFTLHPEGLLYQTPIRAYTTTFHAMQVGAFVGDFIFTFVKDGPLVDAAVAPEELANFKLYVSGLIEKIISGGVSEPQLREKAYKALIPFLSKYSRIAVSSCKEAVDFFESEMRRHDDHFRKLREETIHERRRIYLAKNSKPRGPEHTTLD